MKKLFALLLALVFVLACFAGCTGNQNPSNDPGNATPNQSSDAVDSPFTGHSDQTYYMVTFYPTLSLWAPCWEGFQAAAKDLGVQAELTGPSSLVVAEEVAAVEQAAAMNAAGIAVSPLEPNSFVDCINDTIAAGTPVLCFDSDSAESNRLMYIGTSNYAAGEAGAEELARQVGGKGDVILFTMVGQLNHMERLQGAQDYLAANYPDINVVAVLSSDDGTSAGAAANFAAAMQTYPNVKGVFSTVGTGTIGVAQTMTEFNYEGLVNIGFDTDPSILAKMDEGTCTGTIAQNYYVMGYNMLVYLYTYANKMVNPYDNWEENGIVPLPSNVDTGVTVVTMDNIDLFRVDAE